MDTIKRCSRCITPITLPGVVLDEHGVCNHCRAYDTFNNKWEKEKEKKELELKKIVQQVKKLNRKYDCLISLSGGKDSTYALYIFSKIYNLKCLCVTFDNGLMSDHAKQNIKNAIEITQSDHIFYNVSRNRILSLFKSSVQKCGEFCSICLRGIVLSTEIPIKQFKIPMQVAGTGRRVSYLSYIPELYQGGDPHYLKNVFRGDVLEKEIKPFFVNSGSWYLEKMRKLIKSIFCFANNNEYRIDLYDYFEYSRNEISSILTKEMGWSTPDDKFEHMDCLLDDVSSYIRTIKFPELTLNTLYHCSLIRLGEMSREDALKIEEENFKNPQIPKELFEFLNEINMTYDEFVSYVKNWRNIEKYRSTKKSILRKIYRKIVKN